MTEAAGDPRQSRRKGGPAVPRLTGGSPCSFRPSGITGQGWQRSEGNQRRNALHSWVSGLAPDALDPGPATPGGRAGWGLGAPGQALIQQGSYGRRNREAIAAREMHTAQRLRAVERAYQMAIDHDAAISYDPAAAIRLTDHLADREMELE